MSARPVRPLGAHHSARLGLKMQGGQKEEQGEPCCQRASRPAGVVFSLRGAGEHTPAAGSAQHACARLAQPAATGINSRAVCACLFLSLEVAHFHFLVPFASSAVSVSARACARVPARRPPADAPLRRGEDGGCQVPQPGVCATRPRSLRSPGAGELRSDQARPVLPAPPAPGPCQPAWLQEMWGPVEPTEEKAPSQRCVAEQAPPFSRTHPSYLLGL